MRVAVRLSAACTLLALVASIASAQPQAPPADRDPSLTVRASFKATALGAHAPDARWLFPTRNTATSFWRGRIEPSWRMSDRVSLEAAYEHRFRLFSSPAPLFGSGVLPQETAPPYRLSALEWNLAIGSHGSWDHEIDRAALHVRAPAVELSIGRQAVGWGRGVLFSAIDLFAPFTPLEADREWRRGVDAIRAEVKLTDRGSVDVVGAFGRRPDESAFGVRVRGYTSRFDVEAVAGRRARDPFVGVASSLAVAGAELHGEAAVFETPGVDGSTIFGQSRTVLKTVLGGSSRLPVGAGVLLDVEYHYSGFGAPSAREVATQFADIEFVRRYVRGDSQILSRHALAAIASYQWSPLLSFATEWLQNPTDGSGVVSPSVVLTPSDRWSVHLGAYAPYGHAPDGHEVRSEYGATPLSVVAQVRFYR